MASKKGIIFEIHHFSLNDGPGIRTTIFLKGCPLSCTWCHNYESQQDHLQLYFDPDKCILCGNCSQVCPNQVHSITNEVHELDYASCDLSGACIEVCPSDALKIIGQEMSVDDLLSEIAKDKEYFKNSNGGVTLSGGEPMQQFHFLLALSKRLKKEGYHVCLDTSGFASKKLFEEILPYLDLFHYDIKSFDQKQHLEQTGVGNTVILENLEFLANHGKTIILRCPIIPGFNDNSEHFQQLADLANKYNSIRKIDLLPYHKMGIKKACNLNSSTSPAVFGIPADHQKAEWKHFLNTRTNKPVIIGS